MTGSTEHLLGQSLLCAAWIYVQTVWLVFDELELDLTTFSTTVIDPALTGIAAAQEAAMAQTPPR